MPTSVFAMVLLPIAYFAFFLLMNQESYLGKYRPTGGKRILWNVLVAFVHVARSGKKPAPTAG